MSIRKAVVSFSSSGPDRRPGTADDFIALKYEEPILPSVKLHSKLNRRLSDHQPRKAGLIVGILTNKTGAALAEESVELRMDSWKEGIKARTDVEGKFQFVDLQPGLYSLNIQVAGYRPVFISTIPVIAGYLTPVCQRISLQPYVKPPHSKSFALQSVHRPLDLKGSPVVWVFPALGAEHIKLGFSQRICRSTLLF